MKNEVLKRKLWKAVVAVTMAAVFIAATVIAVTQALALSAIAPDATHGYIYYTDSDASVSVPLDTAVTNENMALFEKQLDDTYTLAHFSALTPDDDELTLSGSFAEYLPSTFYVAVTDMEEIDVEAFDGETALSEEDDLITLEDDDENILELRIIQVIYDPDAPVITTVADDIPDGEAWVDSVTITVSATDTLDENVGVGLHATAYSFDNGSTWVASSSQTFTSNGTVNIIVRDALGQESTATQVIITKIDNQPPIIQDVEITRTGLIGRWAKYITITVTATDAVSGVDAYSFDGGVTWQASNQKSIHQNIQYFIKVRDVAGNIATWEPIDIDDLDTPPDIIIDESTISSNWVAEETTFEFAVDDVGSGYEASAITGTIDNGQVVITQKPGEEHIYIATVTGDAGKVVNAPAVLSMVDLMESPGTATSIKQIQIDREAPSITIDESTIDDDWSAYETSLEVTVTDGVGSGIDISSIQGSVTSGQVDIQPKSGVPGVYVVTVTANDSTYTDTLITIEATDAVGNARQETSIKPIKVDNKRIAISNVSVEKFTGSTDVATVKNGDTIKVSFMLSDEGSGVDEGTVAVRLNGSDAKAAVKDGGTYSCVFAVGSDLTAAEDTLLTLTRIVCDNHVGIRTELVNQPTGLRYYAPITDGLTGLTFVSGNPNPALAKTGDRVYISFSTTHPVFVKDAYVSQTQSANITWTKRNEVGSGGKYDHEGYFTAAADYAYDQNNLTYALTLYDTAGNSEVQRTQADTPGITYFAPIVVSDVRIVSDNAKDASIYAKNGDTVTVSFTTNHDVALSGVLVAGRAPSIIKTDGAGTAKNWTLTYRLVGGELADLADIPFGFICDDAAGNPSQQRTHQSPGVTNSIRYYAPITASTAIASNYKNSDYAKNGDTVTVTARTNHAVSITAATILGRSASGIGNNSTDLRMSYQIPFGEASTSERKAAFYYAVEDVAGNILTVNDTSTAVIYDRTNPRVSITPNTISFSAQTITCTVTFEDEHLYASDISVLLNSEEQMTARDRNSVSGTVFEKDVTLEFDGNYTISATLYDRAGNKSEPDAAVSLTVDMISPEIKTLQISLDKPEVFMAGFIISEYFEFIDENLKDVICTVTDSDGTHDWDIDEPLIKDGKNTINLIAVDMADNSSTVVTYDLYIDGSAPEPVVADTLSGRQLLAGDNEQAFISEMTLDISLKALHFEGFDDPDKFTKLQLVDKDNKLVVDLLNAMSPDADGVYTYELTAFDSYALLVEAVDTVGNQTGLVAYKFQFADKSVFQKYFENTPLFVGSLIVLAIVAAAAVILMRLRRKRNTQTPTF